MSSPWSAIWPALSGETLHADRVDFDVFWVVSQYAGTPSPVHFHSGDVAGVLYLKVPEIDETEEARSYIAGRQPGYINFLIGGKQRLSRSLILNSSPQRHRGTEKVKESMACRFDTNHPTGECMKHGKHLFFLCVLGASVVQLRF